MIKSKAYFDTSIPTNWNFSLAETHGTSQVLYFIVESILHVILSNVDVDHYCSSYISHIFVFKVFESIHGIAIIYFLFDFEITKFTLFLCSLIVQYSGIFFFFF